MRPAATTIHAPPFPRGLPWLRTAQLRVDKQLGRPLVIAFFDARRAVSLRPLLELQRWHEAFASRGARVIGVAVDADEAGVTEAEVERTLDRLGVDFPVVLDEELRIAHAYGLTGIPSRYLFDQGLRLVDAHFGPAGYADGRALLEALVAHGEQQLAERAAAPEPAAPAAEAEEDPSCDQGAAATPPPSKQPRLLVTPPEHDILPEPSADPGELAPPSPADLLPADYRGPYEAGAIWATVRGTGTLQVAGDAPISVEGDGAILLVDHEGALTAGVLELAVSEGLDVLELQLEPGLLVGG
ncbi:MAG: redoxin domain-containing protein [Solirubrobacteraceae bacterium]|nr:redoxin domain-containing protein [Solirubrobacteraceae bacterium]